MRNSKLFANIAKKSKVSQESCKAVIKAFGEEVRDALIAGEKIVIKEFMTFEISERPERAGRNPKTGKVVTFPAVKTVRCKMSKAIRNAINEK